MDSMRSLNTSLPKSTARKNVQPDVHQSFRATAMAVTNLYKSALADIERVRAEGYQEALEDLLCLLDKENLGVGDGEGWRIRQWATERFDGTAMGPHSDSDEETPEEKRARSSSPMMERNPAPAEAPVASEPAATDAHTRSESAPLPASTGEANDAEMNNTPPMFHFSSAQPYPTFDPSEVAVPDPTAAARRAFGAARRTASRKNNLHRNATQNSLFQLGNGAGQKRKMMNDLFNVDFSGWDHDGRGGKRGRTS